MSSSTRKIRRNKMKEAKKDLQEKTALFGKLGSECNTCQEPFDKKDAEQVATWNVVVRENEGMVRLYCPECWGKAVNILEGYKKYLEEKNAN